MTKEMYDKCRNPGMVAFAAMPDDVKAELTMNYPLGNVEYFDCDGCWSARSEYLPLLKSVPYRISYKCKPDDYEYFSVVSGPKRISGKSMWIVPIGGEDYSLAVVSSLVGFEGIEYNNDGGFQPYHCYTYGTPTRVRFKK